VNLQDARCNNKDNTHAILTSLQCTR